MDAENDIHHHFILRRNKLKLVIEDNLVANPYQNCSELIL